MGINVLKFFVLHNIGGSVGNLLNYFRNDYFKFNNVIVFIMIVLCLFTINNAYAFEENNTELSLKQLLLMPGDLTKPHAKIENKCQQCHLHFDKENQSPLCLDCHEDIDNDLKQKRGFHSQIAKDDIKQCNSCHTDHKGRDVDITSLDKTRFDHSETEFPLKNSHLPLACSDCHKSTDKNFRLPLKKDTCTSCHDDPHQGKLKETCTSCHNEKNWQETKFDHKNTDFLLKGKHDELSCQSCHVNDVAVEIGSQCVTCHLSKDTHLNTFGNKCGSCHLEQGWDKTEYDHFKETKFRLVGKHENISCESCHLPSSRTINTLDKKTNALKKTCNGCHKKDDVHLGNNGTDCQQCHDNNDWGKVRFDHDEETSFSLQGAHEKLVCQACHLPSLLEKNITNKSITKQGDDKQLKPARTCHDCHQITDAHNGELGKDCQQCHQQKKWHEQVTFNHDFTLFPLTGAHQLQVCQACHFSSDFTVKVFSCVDCHQEDDPHKKSLGSKCQQCHNSASWSAWQFNHQDQTDYSLEGAHNNLSCYSCHKADDEKPLSPPSQCVACHQNDDVHQGAFGENCQQCHNMDSFNDFKH
jgi:hypothetical protein